MWVCTRVRIENMTATVCLCARGVTEILIVDDTAAGFNEHEESVSTDTLKETYIFVIFSGKSDSLGDRESVEGREWEKQRNKGVSSGVCAVNLRNATSSSQRKSPLLFHPPRGDRF